MDPKRFDALVQSFAAPGSRRRLLGAVVAGAVAPLTAAASKRHGLEPAKCLAVGKRCSLPASEDARHGDGKGGKGKHRRPSCAKCCSRFGAAGPDGKPRCTCKGEGVACDQPSQCCSGDCRAGSCTACPPNTVFCPDGCANLQTNREHCGSCEKACDAGQRCVNGICICDDRSCSTGCCDGTTCQRGTSDSACGTGGATCKTCAANQRCDGTDCVCDPTRGCCSNDDCGGGKTCLDDGTCVLACATVDEACGSESSCRCEAALNGSGNGCLHSDACSCVAECGDCPIGTVCTSGANGFPTCPGDAPILCCAVCG